MTESSQSIDERIKLLMQNLSLDTIRIALKDPEDYVRRRAVQALRKIQDEGKLEVLLEAVTDDYEGVQYDALEALIALNNPNSVQPLLKILATIVFDEDSSVPNIITDILGKTGETGVAQLLQALNEYPDIRREILIALGKSGSVSALSTLIIMIKDKNEDEDMLGQVVWALGAIGDKRAVEPLLELLVDAAGSESLQADIAIALGKIGDERSEASILRLLQSKDGYIRLTSITALGNLKSQAAIETLIELLNRETHFNNRETIIRELANIGGERVDEFLIRVLKGEDKDLARVVIVNAKKLGDTIKPAVLALLEEKNPELLSRAAEAAGYLDMQSEIPRLVGLMLDENNHIQVRLSSIEGLEEMQAISAVADLIKLLKDSNAAIRLQAINTLGLIAGKEAIEALEWVHDNDTTVYDDENLSYEALNAIENIQAREDSEK